MSFHDHIQRLKDGVNNTYSLNNLAPWIEKFTYLDSRKFSFKDHEFQLPIIQDSAQTSIVVKCAQVGLSEISYRYAVAACATQDDFTVIYTFPTTTDAEINNRTRIDPMIDGSPELRRLVNPNMNNSSVKQFGRNSFLFFKGTISQTAALSTPANCVIHDEHDKSDITNASVYVSRLQHKPHKIRKIFSTPTREGYGVSKEAETARRHKHLVKCDSCNHVFLPDYYENIVVPGWTKGLEEISKNNIHQTNWRDAYLACPKCGKDPNLHHTRMEFVCENSAENHAANAWYVSPFSAHNIITPSYLVQASTQFKRVSEFKNQSLGLTAEEESDSITEKDIEDLLTEQLDSSELHVMGADMGLTCHVTIGRVAQDGTYLIVHREAIHYSHFEERTRELMGQYRIYTAVMDTLPYTDLVTRVTKARPNWWGAMYVSTKSPVAYTLHTETEAVQEGKMNLRLAKVNRNIVFDEVLDLIKRRGLLISKSDQDEDYKKQLTSMKRVQKFTKDGELQYVWEKSGDENDHYHHSLIYFYLACQIRMVGGGVGSVASSIPLVSKIINSRV